MVARLTGVGAAAALEGAAPRRLGPPRRLQGAPQSAAVAPVLAAVKPVAAAAPLQGSTAAPPQQPPAADGAPPATHQAPATPMVLQAEALARTQQAAEQAYRRGLAEGAAAAQLEHGQLQARLSEAVATALQALQGRLASAEQLATALTRQTLLQLLGEPAARPQLLAALLQHRLAAVADGSQVRVRLNPQDLQALGDLASSLQATHGAHVLVRGDTAVAPGGCGIDLAMGSLDAGLDTAQALIRQHFQAAAEASPTTGRPHEPTP